MSPGPPACSPTPGQALCLPAVARRLQELEDQYRREREEATYLLEQQRLVRQPSPPTLLPGTPPCRLLALYGGWQEG